MSSSQIILKEGENTFTFEVTPEEIRLLKDFFQQYHARPLQRKSKLKNLKSYI